MTRILLCLAVAAGLRAQAPVVGDINLYGLRKTTADKVMAALALKAGDTLPPSKGDLEDRLEELSGVVLARVTAVCCEDSRAMLFVGLEEKGAPHFAFRSEPGGKAALPEEVVENYRRFLGAVEDAARKGDTAEDLSKGHSLMADPAARAVQLELAGWAAGHLAELRDVLRTAADEEQRAVAAAVLGYAPRKRDIVNDLQFAVQDPDEAVRANALRSLTAVAVLAAANPDLELKVAPTWFVELLHSVALSDRVKSTEALVVLTDSRSQTVLDLLRERALPELAEMARWPSLRYALPAFVLAGRVGGLSEDEIHERWKKGDRESVITAALVPKAKKSR